MKTLTLHKNASIEKVTEGKNHFFGYYETCPWNENETKMLAHEVDFLDRMPEADDVARIMTVNLEDGKKEYIGETTAWNWQVGSLLQWLPGDRERIIFNTRKKEGVRAVIVDPETNEERAIQSSVFDVHPNGREAITLNFARLARTRPGYGYAGIRDLWQNEKVPKEDGIFQVSIETGQERLIISLKDLYETRHLPSMEEGDHWVNHLTYSKSGIRFAFFHRWQTKDGRMMTRLYTADADGKNPYIVTDTGMASHFCWKNDRELLVWGRERTLLSAVSEKGSWMKYALPIYHKLGIAKTAKGIIRRKIIGDNFLLITDKVGTYKRVGSGILQNGHPSFSRDEKWIVTDTYPDKKHYRELMLYHTESNKKISLGKLYALPNTKYTTNANWDEGGMRSDLHPRWSRNGTKVCVDSVHEGTRQIYVVRVSELLKAA